MHNAGAANTDTKNNNQPHKSHSRLTAHAAHTTQAARVRTHSMTHRPLCCELRRVFSADSPSTLTRANARQTDRLKRADRPTAGTTALPSRRSRTNTTNDETTSVCNDTSVERERCVDTQRLIGCEGALHVSDKAKAVQAGLQAAQIERRRRHRIILRGCVRENEIASERERKLTERY